MAGSEIEDRRCKLFSIENAKQAPSPAPVTSDQRQAIAKPSKLDAIGKFQDAAQTFSLYTISLWLVPDTLLAALSSNASE
jgi:hypothetical protein